MGNKATVSGADKRNIKAVFQKEGKGNRLLFESSFFYITYYDEVLIVLSYFETKCPKAELSLLTLWDRVIISSLTVEK